LPIAALSRTPTPLKKAFAEIQSSYGSYLSPSRLEDLADIISNSADGLSFTPETPSKSINKSIYSPPSFIQETLLNDTPTKDETRNAKMRQRSRAAKKIEFSPEKA